MSGNGPGSQTVVSIGDNNVVLLPCEPHDFKEFVSVHPHRPHPNPLNQINQGQIHYCPEMAFAISRNPLILLNNLFF